MSALVDGTDEQRRRLRKTLMEMSMGRGYLIINLETQRDRNKHKRDDPTDKIFTSSSDVFGNLATELTERILMKLSMRDAFKASTVSKNWIHAWNSTPKLVLDDKNFMRFDNYESMFIEFVERVLSSREGPILQFHLSTCIENKMKINRWLFFSMRYNKIKELHLEVCYARKYKVPQLLFSCHELVHLKLVKCKLTPPQDFKGFNMLKNLHLEMVKITDSELKNLLSSCTQLEELAFIDLPWITEIDIRNTKVRQLNIVGSYERFQLENQSLINATLINIFYHDVHDLLTIFFCKNLVHLEISGYKDLVLPSLRDMKLETVKLSLPTLPPDSITNLVSECHQLKKLDVMIHDTDYQEIQIVSTSLQSLKIGRRYSHLHLACPQLIDASIYIGTDLYFWDSVSHYCCFRKKQRLSLKELEYRQTKVTLPVAFNHLEKLSLEVRFGNLMCEYIAFSFIQKAHRLHTLQIKCGIPEVHLGLSFGSDNFWEYLLKSGLEIRFKNLITLTILHFNGSDEEISFLKFMVNAAPMLQEIKVIFLTQSTMDFLTDPHLLYFFSNVEDLESISCQRILASIQKEGDRKLKVEFVY
ncbi:hypothetical protein J5N97_003187 [Dioscorea zingiberensis]|uniref:Uncharacterized protein n=1 Tax=Dioscorea zingiberensis TaxID=325984 RepID=A0A9D5D3R6_9LILI|nr:hypothetical protein J5N97_003187 [Dioscorea zingiberensis]